MKLNPESETYKKVERFLNPKTVEDYGLSISEAEMREHPFGRQIIAIKLRSWRSARVASVWGANAARTLDELRLKVLRGEAE